MHFASDCIGPEAAQIVAALKPGEVALLENLRFHPEEEKNDTGFARQLAALGDLYVDDAFSAAHRAHASIAALAHLLPNAAGKLMQAELEALGAALEHPEHPVMALIGGSKVSTKLDLLKFILSKVDKLAIGGAMANTFLFAQGRPVGRSLCEKEMADTARAILAAAEKRGCEVILPEDAVTAEKLEPGVVTRTVGVNAVPQNAMILDIGPDSVARISNALEGLQDPGVERSGRRLRDTALRPRHGRDRQEGRRADPAGKLMSVAGGGDTVAALAAAGVEDELTYVSTAGGAFLEWLEGKELPGVAALSVR